MQAATVSPEELVAGMGAPLDPAVYDWRAAADGGLGADEEFQLTYAAQVEWGTEGTFASLDISRDPLVRRFLQIWLAQEVVHAELLARFLAARGVAVEAVHRRPVHRRGAARGRLLNRLARLAVGDDFFGVHMAWGAVNELTTLRFYGVVRSRTESPLLRDILRDVMAQEAQHYAFYRAVAIDRLTGNRRGQRIVRFALERLWTPVGLGLRTPADADRLMLGLFADRPDQVAQMDAQINRIPGLDGLDLVHRTMRRAMADDRFDGGGRPPPSASPDATRSCHELDTGRRSRPSVTGRLPVNA